MEDIEPRLPSRSEVSLWLMLVVAPNSGGSSVSLSFGIL